MSDEANETKTVWEIDSTHPEQAKIIREALRQVNDPELGLNVIELGLVRQVRNQDESLHVTMILTTPFCPYGPAMLEMARSKAAEASGMETSIEMGMEMWSPSMMEDSATASWGLF
jgi:metal-sulfur cluster biosynthetic enzyme